MRILIFLILFLSSCQSLDKVAGEREFEVNEEEFSFMLYDLDSKEIVSSYNENKILAPASVFKLLTAYAYLETIGHQKRFKTKIYIKGQVVKGVLKGDLIIRGGGDPSLNYQDLYNIASLIKKNGIKKIEGNLLYKDDFLASFSEINDEQPDAGYNPGISGLVLQNSKFIVESNFRKKEFFTVPRVDFMNFNFSKKVREVSYLGKRKWKLGRSRKYILPIRDPSYFVANMLKDILLYQGIKVKAVKKVTKIDKSRFLLSYKSKSLIEILRYNLGYSHNLTSEILLLHFAKASKCRSSSLEQASLCLRKWYEKRFPNLDWRKLYWANGSGLSLDTGLTAKHLVAILEKYYKKIYGNNHAISLLPISGLNGTLRNRFPESSLNIWAKTGRMNFVSSLAGFLFDDKHRYAFVIFANDSDNRKILDMAKIESNHSKHRKMIKKAKIWKKEVYEKQKELMSLWLEK
jgi:serine-type D-Ala-D-Ala carboxypeptidase/endopeptidase (penicillin-binding protein 4)